MRKVVSVLLLTFLGGTLAQFPGASLFSSPWTQHGGGGSSYPTYGKPIRPSPFGYGTPIGNFGRPPAPTGSNAPVSYDDDPVPVPSSIESAFEPPQFPSRLPIKAPNGVVEIYNRVVDDLIKKLKVDYEKAELDPMRVVIRSTPPGPVRVPGHLQKRPFRRPGAALYRSNSNTEDFASDITKLHKKIRRGGSHSSEEDVQEDEYYFGKQDETPRSNAEETQTKTETNVEIPSEPSFDEYPRSDEPFSDEIPTEEVKSSPKSKPKKKKEQEAEDDESSEAEGNKDDEAPLLQNRKGEAGSKKNKDVRYKSGNVTTQKKDEEKTGSKKKPEVPHLEEEPEEDPPSIEDEDEEDHDDFDDHEPGTLQSAGNRPMGGYYPNAGAPVVPSKPNAELRGLANMVRASDVVVGVDARSALITARLLVGPLTVHINSSAEPLERGVNAVIPELEAEMILMERHGVIFLQRFTLDRVYGQDVEISVPKVKTEKKKKGGTKVGTEFQSGFDPMHPGAVQRYQTKMGAHLSMEVVKLLRSGNLRLQIMRTAQGAMAKVRLPIKTSHSSKKRSRKNKKKKNQQRRSERE